jgi:hypothetical protein
MPLTDYPVFAGLALPQPLPFERAIWGKVDGARSDFRWIARSPGFQGHKQHVQKELTIGSEEQPQKAPFWRWCERTGCYYALSCYQSRARDIDDRSGFMEKQIIEWRPNGLPAVLGALLLLPEVAKFDDNLAVSGALDPGWTDLTFSLGLKSEPVEATAEGLIAALENGRRELLKFPDELLVQFFQDLAAGSSKALLASTEGPVAPEALAVLLLALPRERADQTSLAGWIPSKNTDTNALRSWDGLVCDPNQRPASPGELSADGKSYSKARQQVHILRGFTPAVRRILEFANDSRERFLDSVEIAGDDITDIELAQLEDAISRVQRDAADSSDPDERMKSARQRQLLSKAEVIRAASMLLAPERVQRSDDSDLLLKILETWRKTAQGLFRERIDSLISSGKKTS